MKINKLNDSTFYNFASKLIGTDVRLYQESLELKRTGKGVKLKMYLGGESEDQRKCFFQDFKCVFVNYLHGDTKQDVSYDWICFILENADELSAEDKQSIVDAYNEHIEQEINNFATQRREQLINR